MPRKFRNDLDPLWIQEKLSYDPLTGFMTWKETGKRAGHLSTASGGYLVIKLGRRRCMAHRLAWVIHHGQWPEHFIDHVNMNRGDNRLVNLREATNSQNIMNTKPSCVNASGVKGVHWQAQKKKWRAQITVNQKRISLGLFEHIETAAAAYAAAAFKYHGDFARVQ